MSQAVELPRVGAKMRERVAPLVDALLPRERVELALFVLQMMRRARETSDVEFELLVADLREVARIDARAWGDGPRCLGGDDVPKVTAVRHRVRVVSRSGKFLTELSLLAMPRIGQPLALARLPQDGRRSKVYHYRVVEVGLRRSVGRVVVTKVTGSE
jgi:hypothetical protein